MRPILPGDAPANILRALDPLRNIDLAPNAGLGAAAWPGGRASAPAAVENPNRFPSPSAAGPLDGGVVGLTPDAGGSFSVVVPPPCAAAAIDTVTSIVWLIMHQGWCGITYYSDITGKEAPAPRMSISLL